MHSVPLSFATGFGMKSHEFPVRVCYDTESHTYISEGYPPEPLMVENKAQVHAGKKPLRGDVYQPSFPYASL